MSKIRTYYNRLSYQRKLSNILNVIFLLVIVVVVVVSFLFSSILTDEIYDRNREKLSMLSSNIEEQLVDIEDVISAIHQNSVLQSNLIQGNSPDLSYYQTLQVKGNIANELNYLLADEVQVKGVTLFNSAGEMLMGSSTREELFKNFSVSDDIIAELATDSRTGYWFFDKSLQNGLFVQNVYSTRAPVLQKVGTIFININTDFIQKLIDQSGLFSAKDMFVLEDRGELYTTKKSANADYLNFVTENKAKLAKENTYQVAKVNGTRYYVYGKTIDAANNSFHLYYFLLNSQVIQLVIRIQAIFLAAIIILFLVAIYLANRYLARLIQPINQLAATMKKFEGETDLEQLLTIEAPLMPVSRTDEIGVLYQSFHELIAEIENLVIKDYKSKLLTQQIEHKFLQAQLDPHFLYNTLNSINYLALSKGDLEISEMVTSLALLFRKKISNADDWSTVEEELELIHAYINIQSVRFKTRLVFVEQVEPETLKVKIPSLIIQPLVENAIKYGVEAVNRPVNILVSIAFSGNNLEIHVNNDGPAFVVAENNLAVDSTGIGIKNIQARLDIFFATQATFEITSSEGVGTKITIILPVTKNKEAK